MKKIIIIIIFNLFLLISCVNSYSVTPSPDSQLTTYYTSLYYHNYPAYYYKGDYWYWNNYRWVYIERCYHKHIYCHKHKHHNYHYHPNRPIHVTKPYNPNYKHHNDRHHPNRSIHVTKPYNPNYKHNYYHRGQRNIYKPSRHPNNIGRSGNRKK